MTRCSTAPSAATDAASCITWAAIRPPRRPRQTEDMQSIIDGTSMTLLVGEYHTVTNNRRRSFWAYSYASYALGTITVGQPRILLPDYLECVRIGGAGADNPCKRGMASLHPGIIQFCLADCSVRGIATTVNFTVLENLATIAGKEIVQLPN